MRAQFDVKTRREFLDAARILVTKSPGSATLADVQSVTEPLAKLLSEMVGEECIIILKPTNEKRT